jgi:HD-GYP domain-containing protein (c-di-GMP phosphodiesterase class II)
VAQVAASSVEEEASILFMPSDPLTEYLRRLPSPVHSLLLALEERNPATAAHGRRVAAMALRLAEFSHRFDPEQLRQVFLAGYLHDLGKLAVPLSILESPEPLEPAEWEVVQMASACGEALLRPYLPPGDPIVEAVRAEHERWDGRGYPDGLHGIEIPEIARIVLIADTLDALRMHQAYRRATGTRDALKVLENGAGSQFDPHWVQMALRLWGEGVVRPGPAPTPIPRMHSDNELGFGSQRRAA